MASPSAAETTTQDKLRVISSDAMLATGSTTAHAHVSKPPLRPIRRHNLTVASSVIVTSYLGDPPSPRQSARAPRPNTAPLLLESTSRVLFRAKHTFSPEVVVYSTLPQHEDVEKDSLTREADRQQSPLPKSCNPHEISAMSTSVNTSDITSAVKSYGSKLAMAPIEIQSFSDSCLGFEDYSTTQCMYTTSTSVLPKTLTPTSERAHVPSSSAPESIPSPSFVVTPSTSTYVEHKYPAGHSAHLATAYEPSTSFENTLKASTSTYAPHASFQDDSSSTNESFEHPLTDSEDDDEIEMLDDLDLYKDRLVWVMRKYQERMNRRDQIKKLVARIRAEVQNLRALVRKDTGDSWFKSAEDPASVLKLLRKQEHLRLMMSRMRNELLLLREQHIIMKAIHDDAYEHIMAARRRHQLYKMAADRDRASGSGTGGDFQDL